MDKETMREYGIDYEKGISNCMSNESLYMQVLSMFLDDKCFANSKEAYATYDRLALFRIMHELKGISGNAALFKIYDATSAIVELLRMENTSIEEIEQLYMYVEETYRMTCRGIKLLLA